MKLTVKQENFCNYYLESGNASEAYRRSYGAEKMKDESIHRKAFELLENVKVTARIAELQEEQKKVSDISKESLLKELNCIAFSSIAHLHNTWIERKDFDELTDEQKRSIKNISTKVQKRTGEDGMEIEIEYIKVELHDKLKAMEMISKLLGYDAPVKNEVTGKDGKDLIPSIQVEIIDKREHIEQEDEDTND